MLKILAIAALLLGAPAAFSQTVSSCPIATPGTVWSAGAWLPCSTTVAYVAQPVAPTSPVSDMRCTASGCVYSWQLGPNVLPNDQVWAKTTAKPNGTWVFASTLRFGNYASAQCTRFLYLGAPLTMVSTTGPNTATVSSPVTGSVTLINPLPANGTTTFAPSDGGFVPTPGLVSWDFSSQDPLLSSAVSVGDPYAQPTFTFTTRDGVIVGWNFTIPYFQNLEVGSYNESIKSSSSNGDTVLVSVAPVPIPPDTVPYSITGSTSSPGTWTCLTTYTSNFP